MFVLHSSFADLPAAFQNEKTWEPLFNPFQTEGQEELRGVEDKFLDEIKSMKASLDEKSLRRVLISFAERRCKGESVESIMKSGPIYEPDSFFLKTFLEAIPVQFVRGLTCGRIQEDGTSTPVERATGRIEKARQTGYFRAPSSVLTLKIYSSTTSRPPYVDERNYTTQFTLKDSEWFEDGEWTRKEEPVSLGKMVLKISYPVDERDRIVLGLRHQMITNTLALVPFKRNRFPGALSEEEFPLLQTVQQIPKADRIPALERLAAKGDLEAIHLIGLLYELGEGTKANPQRAFEYYQRAAKDNFKPSLVKVGMAHLKGVATERNEESAKRYFETASSLGSVPALSKLGWLLSKNEATKQLGKEYLLGAAERGDSEALLHLAEMALNERKSRGEILDFLELPMAKQNAKAAFIAGRLFASKEFGESDRPEALRLLMLSCSWLKHEDDAQLAKDAGSLAVQLRSAMTAEEKFKAFNRLSADSE